MIAYYDIEAFKIQVLTSHKLLNMVKKRDRKVCLEVIHYLTNIKRDYPQTRAKMDDSINQMKRTYETIEWAEETGYTNHTHYEIVEYVIKESYGSLFKHMMLVNPELLKFID